MLNAEHKFCINKIEFFIKINKEQTMTELNPKHKIAEQILYDLWYSIAETIFERVCKVTELNDEQIEALRTVALRPNDFQISIQNSQLDS